MNAKNTNPTSSAAPLTAEPIAIPKAEPAMAAPPEFIRLPPVGMKCPESFYLSRGSLNEIVLPTPRNGYKPPVKSYVLRQHGAKTGIRLIDRQSLVDYIRAHPDESHQG